MAGHSQFKNIMYRKGAQDKKRAKLFSKLIREIMSCWPLSGVRVPNLKFPSTNFGSKGTLTI